MADETLFPDAGAPQTGDTVLFPDAPVGDGDPFPPTPAEPEIVDYTVAFGGRTFEIGEPDLATVCAICNALGDIMLTAERHLGQRLQGLFTEMIGGKVQSAQPFEATMFGLLAVLQPQHVMRIGAIVLFGGKEPQKREASEFFRTLPEDQLKLAPLVKAFALRVRQSDDLAAALGNFRLAQGAVTTWAAKASRGNPAAPAT